MKDPNNIYIIPQLHLDHGQLKCRPNGKRALRDVHFQQGDLDGACGVYSILMALGILGVFEPGIVLSNTLGKMTSIEKKLIRELNQHGLYRKGLSGKGVKEIIDKSFRSTVEVSYHRNIDNDKTLQMIVDDLSEAQPVIIGLANHKCDFYHWVLAVGYQYDEHDDVSAILILDPGSRSPNLCYWNGIVHLSKKKIHYMTEYFKDYAQDVELEDAIFLTQKPLKKD